MMNSFDVSQLWAQLPFLILVIGGLFALLVDAFAAKSTPRGMMLLSVGVCVAALLGVGSVWSTVMESGAQTLFGGMLVVDGFSLFVTAVVILSAGLAFLQAGDFLHEHDIQCGEFFPLGLFALSGMVMLASASDLISMFLAIEIMSLSLYVLTGAFLGQRRSIEGALKYFVMGAFASGLYVYGMALVYGTVGSSTFVDIAASGTKLSGEPVFLFGMFLLVGSLAFKIAAVPFHMWAPDAYEGAPTPVTALMAAGVKAASVAAMARLMLVAFGGKILPFGGMGWGATLGVLAAASMTIGNVAALRQENVKRLLAYSSIAHAGVLILGVIAAGIGSDSALPSLLFYLLAYSVTTLGTFGVVAWIGSRGDERSLVDDWNGLASKHPAAALAMTICLLSLAGVPPTGGFFGKFYLFKAAMEAPDNQLLWLVIVGVLNSVVSAYYYLRIIMAMYFREARPGTPEPRGGWATKVAIGLSVAAVLILGILPSAWLNWATQATLFGT